MFRFAITYALNGLKRESMALYRRRQVFDVSGLLTGRYTTACMKYLAVCIFGLTPGWVSAQETIQPTEPDVNGVVSTSGYVAMGLSMSNTGDATFGEMSYPSLELGVSRGAGSLGLVVGRSNLASSGIESADNYWWEVKGSVAAPLGDFSAYGLLGFGNYLTTKRFFIEYGLGVSYSWDSLSVFAQASNWDGDWYVTPGLMYSFR